MEKRTIRVTGKGKISVEPDLTIVSVGISGKEKEYSETMKKSVKMTAVLKELFSEVGIDQADVKTTSFGIEKAYKAIEEHDTGGIPDFLRNKKKKFDGYRFDHKVKVEFDSDNELLGRILYKLGHSKLNPVFDIAYSIKDKEAAKNRLLEEAIADSKEKAKIIAKAAGINLGEIVEVDYSWGELQFFRSTVDMLEADDCYDEDECYPMDINPEDITAEDTVTVVWSIS